MIWLNLFVLWLVVVDVLIWGFVEVGVKLYVMCYVFYVYLIGVLLYFIVFVGICFDLFIVWGVVKVWVNDVILVVGGMISYYYVVGWDYVFWLVEEIGDIGVWIFVVIKCEFDLVGIFNLGVVIFFEWMC